MIWFWPWLLIILTVALHATSIALMAVGIRRMRMKLIKRKIEKRHALLVLIGTIAVAGLILAFLHGVEALLWAGAYMYLGALPSFDDALFYSIDTMTTRGASGLTLPHHLQMIGAWQAVDGVLLFGMSTAFIFAAFQRGFVEIAEIKEREDP